MIAEGSAYGSSSPKRPATSVKSGECSPRRRILSARSRAQGLPYVPFPYVELYKHHGKSPFTPRSSSQAVPEQSVASLFQRIAKSVHDNENTYIPVKEGFTVQLNTRKSHRKLSQPQLKKDSELCVKSIPLGVAGSGRSSPEAKTRKSVTVRADWRQILDRTQKAMKPHRRKLTLSHLRTAVQNTFSSPKSLRRHNNSATIVMFAGEEVSPREKKEEYRERKKEEDCRERKKEEEYRERKKEEEYRERKKANPPAIRLQEKMHKQVVFDEKPPAETQQKSVKRMITVHTPRAVKIASKAKTAKKDAQIVTESIDDEEFWAGFQAKYLA